MFIKTDDMLKPKFIHLNFLKLKIKLHNRRKRGNTAPPIKLILSEKCFKRYKRLLS